MKKLKSLLFFAATTFAYEAYSQGSFWNILGNAGTTPGTHFVGTTDANRLVFKTVNTERATILTNGNIGIGTNNPQVRLAVNGPGTNVYVTDVWTENNQHVQGNENLLQGGRGRLRIGTAGGYVGLYSENSSSGLRNDLILAASSGLVRVAGAGPLQNLLVGGQTYANNLSNVYERTNRVNGIWANETFDPWGLNGVHIFNAEQEQGGYFANGNYSAIYGPGDNDLVKFMDEDWFNNAGTIYDNSAMKARIDGVGNYWVVSDRTLKTNVQPIADGLNRIRRLTGYTFDYVQNDEELAKAAPVFRSAGVIAQELDLVLPEAVSSENHVDGTFMVNYAALSSLFIQAIKELDLKTAAAQTARTAEIDALNQKIKSLEETIARLCESGCAGLKSKTAAAIEANTAPADKLYQSVPNPTDNMATINYSLQPGYRQASITLFGQDGKPVKTINLNPGAGEGSVKISLAGLNSGSYVYSLNADGKLLGSKQMQVIK